MAEEAGSSLFNTRIRNAIVLSENLISHEGVTDYAATSKVAEDIRNFTDEIEERCKHGKKS